MPHGQNTVHVTLSRSSPRPGTVRLKLRPSLHFRAHDAPVSTPLAGLVRAHGAAGTLRAVRRRRAAPAPAAHARRAGRVHARRQDRRADALSRRGAARRRGPGRPVEPRLLPRRSGAGPGGDAGRLDRGVGDDRARCRRPRRARAERDRRAQLLACAPARPAHGRRRPSWCSRPTSSSSPRRAASRTRRAARAAGDEVRTVIAGYHWFTDWGRDTMISLEGLTLTTGRHAEAGYILRTFAQLRPRRADPEPVSRGREGGALSHGRRHALVLPRPRSLPRRAPATAPRCAAAAEAASTSSSIICAGTRFGIGVDPADGLLRQGAEGYQLTWMDAKVGDWVVTPRRGKAVEINALWYNALRLLDGWLERGAATSRGRRGRRPTRCGRASRSTARFWNARRRLSVRRRRRRARRRSRAAVRTSSSPSRCRIPVLDPQRWKRGAGRRCASELLTPVGLRSLAPGHPDYKATYYGDLRARDAAYHQGTVWAWLIGPFIDAWLRVHPDDRAGARALPRGLRAASRARRASARSARSSTPKRRSRRAAASPRPGAWPKCCAAG